MEWAGSLNGTQTVLYVRACGQVTPDKSCDHTAGVCAVMVRNWDLLIFYLILNFDCALRISHSFSVFGVVVCSVACMNPHSKLELVLLPKLLSSEILCKTKNISDVSSRF